MASGKIITISELVTLKVIITLSTWYDGDRLERAEHPERAEGGEGAEVPDEELDVGHGDDGKVEPVPPVAQVRELVHDEPAGQNLHRELVTANLN